MGEFYPNACIVCFSTTALLRCSRCQMLSYCDLKHQKQHWPEHKDLCRIISTMMKERGVSHLFEKLRGSDLLTWNQERILMSLEAELRVCRDFEINERFIFTFPRSCFVCHESRQDLLKSCPGCPSTSFCPEHPNSPIHDEDCAKIRECYKEGLRKQYYESVTLQSAIVSILAATKPLKLSNQPASLREFLFEFANPKVRFAPISEHLRLYLAETFSITLTIFSALQKLDYPSVSELTIHAGCLETPVETAVHWETLLHLLPNMKVLKVLVVDYRYLIGEYDKKVQLCPKCTKEKRKLIVEFTICPYGVCMTRASYKEPDILMYSNLALPHREGGTIESAKNLVSLWPQLKCPLIITSFTETDNRLTKQIIHSILGNIEMCFEGINPFKSLLYFRTFDDGRVGSTNHHMIILKPKYGLQHKPSNELPPLSDAKQKLHKTNKSSKTTKKDAKSTQDFFYASICHVCHSTNTSVACKRCKMVFYCRKAHQDKHHSQHKDLCKVILGMLNERGTPNLFDKLPTTDPETWLQTKIDLMLKARSKLGRKLLDYEEQMFLFPKTCAICHESDLSVLRNCECGVNLCKVHKDDQEHKKFCQDLSLAFNLTTNRPQVSKVIVKALKNEENKALPTSMETIIDSYLKLKKSSSEINVPNFEKILVSDFLTRPLTLLWCLQKLDYQIDSSIVLHVIGATSWEISTQEFWKIILYRCQKLKTLKIVFIGPEIFDFSPNLETGLQFPSSALAGKSLEVESHAMRYEEYFQSESFNQPNIIVGFNLHFHESAFEIFDCTWKETIQTMKEVDAPFIVTSGSKARAQKDHKRFCQLFKKPVDPVCLERNPFAGLIPERDFETEKLRFPNQYLIIYKGLYKEEDLLEVENV